jgi:EAL domain-containing protein (putative c-di-GMP-specific phosphodiesterase class I)/DNA-binding NarL/FixJ family response regulator
MPHGGGPRAASEIDGLPDPPSTVAFSAYDDRSAIISMLEAGACGYLVKGASNAEIVTTLLEAARSGTAAEDPELRSAGRGQTISVVLADEPGAARESLAVVLESHPEFRLAGVASNPAEALRLSCIHHPSAVLIGRGLPGDGTTAIREIHQAAPDTRVLAYTAEAEPRGVRAAIEAGAMSFVVRGEQDEEILQALRDAARGRSTLSPAAASAVVTELTIAPLTARERRRRERRRAQLERFIRGEGLDVALQPIFELSSGSIVAVEALARFNAGAGEGPSVWFVEAEEQGLGPELELAAFRAALRVLDALPSRLRLSVNVSPQVAASERFIQAVCEAPAERIIVELTEHAAVEDYGALEPGFTALRRRGLTVAVDDAGAGFSSLRHVLMLEPDYIKLDISLCAGIAADRRRRALARSLLAFADEIEIRTVAEGVESAADLEVLRQLGVACAQGYHLARPQPPESVLASL